jgi:hypothetical protein
VTAAVQTPQCCRRDGVVHAVTPAGVSDAQLSVAGSSNLLAPGCRWRMMLRTCVHMTGNWGKTSNLSESASTFGGTCRWSGESGTRRWAPHSTRSWRTPSGRRARRPTGRPSAWRSTSSGTSSATLTGAETQLGQLDFHLYCTVETTLECLDSPGQVLDAVLTNSSSSQCTQAVSWAATLDPQEEVVYSSFLLAKLHGQRLL